MMEFARVTVQAVEQFIAEVTAVSRLTSDLSGCEETMAELYSFLDDLANDCEKSINELNAALGHAKDKKAEYDALVNQLTAERTAIVSELQTVRTELSATPKYFIETDSEGKPHKVRNPEYDHLRGQLYEIEQRLNDVNQRLSEARTKLERAKSAIYKVSSHIKEITNAHKQLGESKIQCRKIHTTFTEVKNDTRQQTSEAAEVLTKIMSICRCYLDQQLKLEALKPAYHKESIVSSGSLAATTSNSDENSNDQRNVLTNEERTKQAIQQTDDNGQVYRINDELVKNAEFQINGYTYKTDNNSRTIQASGKLQIPLKHERVMENMKVVGKGDQRDTDDRGHLIGHQFFGSDRLENLVPQEQRINQGSYARLETHLADLVNAGKEVYVSVTPFYKDTRRPEAIFYYYSVNGHSSAVFFTNTLSEEISNER